MNANTSRFTRTTRYDPFLSAELGEERNGMPLSMISALARLDLDPLSEAAALAAMPADAARDHLSMRLANSAATLAGASTSVDSLLALLPQGADAAMARPQSGTIGAGPSRWIVFMYVLVGLTLALAPQLWEAAPAPHASVIPAPAPILAP